ncbi:MAG TPA: carbohydrate ABC transporter permease [Erysipelothrix sp.]|nr:carbohydrate ABC transporter permease [Erysipelothrix sp.]
MEKRKLKEFKFNQTSTTTNIVFNVILTVLAISSVFPLIFVAAISITSELSIITKGYQIIPSEVSLEGYKFLWEMRGQILNSFAVSVFVTIVGSMLNVFITTTYAYALSRPEFEYRKFYTIILLITMLFTAGMVPSYLVMKSMLKLHDTVWSIILPLALAPFNVIIMRTFFRRSIPDSIIESAKVDGAGDIRIFVKIVLPLAIPGIATITLFAVLGYWNDWFNAMLYIDKSHLMPLQYLLMQIQSTIEYFSQNSIPDTAFATIPKEATQMAMVLISTIPIASTYPFFQKYFVGGLTVGGVKE